MSLPRRDFLAQVGAVAATAALSSCSTKPPDNASTPQLPVLGDVSWNKAPCRFCGVGCGVEVAVQENKVVAVRGDTASPACSV
jgi:nitrate reductase (cytochrome)